MSIRIATWNVNSVNARLAILLDWLRESKTDIVLLQEIKCLEEKFPYLEIEELGYNIAVSGQKTYNGVAILSKFPLEDVTTKLPYDDTDEQARYIEAVISLEDKAIRVASVYVPNGADPESDKFQYKLQFFDRLHKHAQKLLEYEEILIIGGDYNVAIENVDVYAPEKLRNTICFHHSEQEKFRALEYLGLTDAYRAKYPEDQQFTWWDYRAGGWQQNKGMRIDYLMLSAQCADLLSDCGVDAEIRDKEKTSDHAPLWCII